MKTRIAVLVSGGGTNLQALINAQQKGEIPDGSIEVVISNNQDAFALKRAEKNNIPSEVILLKNYVGQAEFENAIIALLKQYDIELIVLAGFLSILTEHFTNVYRQRIINVHPSLIPSFCGKGYYGLKVHQEALAYGVKVSGATVHFVNEIPDGGKIIMQKAVKVMENDTPSTLQKRIMRLCEWQILPKSVQKVAKMIREQGEEYEYIRY